MKKKTYGIGAIIATGFVLLLSGCNSEEIGSDDQPFYVANAGEGTISVIDPTENTEIEKIEIGSEQTSHGIAASLDGKKIYAGTGFNGKSLALIDAKSKKVEKEVNFDEGVHGIDLSFDGKKLFVSLTPGLGKEGGKLAILDADSFEILSTIDTGYGPAHVAVTPNGGQVWVANANDESVSVINAKDNTVIKTIQVGKVPNEVAVTPDGQYVFVANVESDLVSVINVNSLEIKKTIKAGDGPHGVTVSPNGEELWVANNNSNDLTIIDTATLSIKAIIPTGSYANHVAFSQDGNWGYVTNRSSNELIKINTSTKEIIERIAVGSEPHEISLEDYVNTSPKEINYQFESIENQSATNSIENHRAVKETKGIVIEAVHIEDPKLIQDLNIDVSITENELVFFALTTHSGDISNLIQADNLLFIDKAGKEVSPTEVIALNKDSHHPEFIAIFPTVDAVNSVKLQNINKESLLMKFK
ncbi:YncE family protein [Bacillaceae bacterium S4-13-58]